MRLLILILTIIIFTYCTGERKSDKKSVSGRFVKVEITDKYLKKILRDYSKSYDFSGKGVLMTNITTKGDTTKYVVFLFTGREFFDVWLRDKKTVLYDTIDNRIAILTTKNECFFSVSKANAVSDTLLDKYLINKTKFHEIWELEYSRIGDSLKHKVVYYDAFN